MDAVNNPRGLKNSGILTSLHTTLVHFGKTDVKSNLVPVLVVASKALHRLAFYFCPGGTSIYLQRSIISIFEIYEYLKCWTVTLDVIPRSE